MIWLLVINHIRSPGKWDHVIEAWVELDFIALADKTKGPPQKCDLAIDILVLNYLIISLNFALGS